MKNVNQLPDGNKNSIFRFGLWGWVTILYCLLMFFLYVGMCNDGANITAPAITAENIPSLIATPQLISPSSFKIPCVAALPRSPSPNPSASVFFSPAPCIASPVSPDRKPTTLPASAFLIYLSISETTYLNIS